MTRVLGCDPGLGGALVLWDDAGNVLEIEDVPTLEISVGKSARRRVHNDAEYARLFRSLAPDRVVIEQVNGIKGQSASASFSFGVGYGLLRGFAATLALPVDLIPPAVWRSRLRVPAGKDGSRARATQLFPAHARDFARVKDDGRADAALLARCLFGLR